MTGSVDGFQEVSARISAEIDEMGGATMAGLLEGGLKVQAKSQDRVPVDTGNLKGSAYTRKERGGATAVEVGYGAAYALGVHEDMEARHETGQAKYLESALYDSETEILESVERHAQVDQ